MAAAVAPKNGTGGQQIDIALMLADGGPKGRADPAFDAHTLPIGEWARAVWEERLPRLALMALAAQAMLQLAKAKRIWATVHGPGAAMVATCARIQWTVRDAFRLVTDTGTELDLRLDPPAAVDAQVKKAVERWRWRNIEKSIPELATNGSGRGAMMQPIWSLLRSRKRTLNGTQPCEVASSRCWQIGSFRKRDALRQGGRNTTNVPHACRPSSKKPRRAGKGSRG